MTNNHVVDKAQGLEVVLSDGTKVKGELVGTDAYTDLAVIKISSDKVDQVAEFGNSSKITVGEPAIAIGSPLGSDYANSVTQGIISSVNRNITNKNESGETININAIQTDAAINPGNSGGPLINIEGQVIGINSVKIVQSTSQVSVEGMGFAIPSNDVVNIINQLEKDGKVTRPALGITMSDLTGISSQQQEQILKIPASVKTGVVVRGVEAATPAEKAGLEKYDVITKVDGQDVSSTTDLQSALYKKKVGDKMEVTYYRGSKEMKATIDLTIDKSALTQQNNRKESIKERNDLLSEQQVVSFFYSPTANAEPTSASKGNSKIPFLAGAFGKRNSFAEQIIPKLSSPRKTPGQIIKPSGIIAPGLATTTFCPALIFGAPQTICKISPLSTSVCVIDK